MKTNWFTVKKIKKDIWGIGEFRHPEEVISYLILGKTRAVLFDTGLGRFNIRKIIAEITSLPIIVINSHKHYDHVGGNKFFSNIYKPRDGKVIRIGKFNLEIIFTPGHSDDSLCLYEKNYGYLFSGDTIYSGPIYLFLKESNINKYKESIKKLLSLKKINKIFPAHNNFYCPTKTISLINKKLSSPNLIKENNIKIDNKTNLLFKR